MACRFGGSRSRSRNAVRSVVPGKTPIGDSGLATGTATALAEEPYAARRGRWVGLGRALLLGLLIALIHCSGLTLALDKRNYDLWFQLSAPQDAMARSVAVVAIDAQSLADASLGGWPWPSERIARLVEAVCQAQPAAVGLDILLDRERDETDPELARVLAAHPEVVLVAALRGTHNPNGDLAVEWPLPEFMGEDKQRVGFGNFVADRPDGSIRSFRQTVHTKSGQVLSFPTRLALAATDARDAAMDVSGQWISLPNHTGTACRWPVTTTINYRRPSQIPTFSALDVLGSQASVAGLSGRVVLIGGIAVGEFTDLFRTPFSEDVVAGRRAPMHGVEIQANAVETLLSGQQVREASSLLACAAILIFVVATCYALRRLRPSLGALAALGIALVGTAASLLLFSRYRIQLSTTPLVLGAAVAYAMVGLEKYAVAEDRRRREDAMFRMLEFYRGRVFHKMASQVMLVRYSLEEMGEQADRHPSGADPRAARSGLRHLDVLSDYLENINLADVIRLEEAEPRRDVIDVAELVRGARRDFRRAYENAGLVLDSQIPDYEVWVLADPGQLRSALDTLLENALKYVPGHGTRVAMVCRADGRYAVVELEDDGPGMPGDDLSMLFDPFYRGRGARAEGVKGMGLGLFISKSIIERHGGAIEARSRAGHGTTFRLRLPMTGPTPGEGKQDGG